MRNMREEIIEECKDKPASELLKMVILELLHIEDTEDSNVVMKNFSDTETTDHQTRRLHYL